MTNQKEMTVVGLKKVRRQYRHESNWYILTQTGKGKVQEWSIPEPQNRNCELAIGMADTYETQKSQGYLRNYHYLYWNGAYTRKLTQAQLNGIDLIATQYVKSGGGSYGHSHNVPAITKDNLGKLGILIGTRWNHTINWEHPLMVAAIAEAKIQLVEDEKKSNELDNERFIGKLRIVNMLKRLGLDLFKSGGDYALDWKGSDNSWELTITKNEKNQNRFSRNYLEFTISCSNRPSGIHIDFGIKTPNNNGEDEAAWLMTQLSDFTKISEGWAGLQS